MDTMENTGGMGSYGFIIFFILLFWFFGGNTGLFGRGCANNVCSDISNCDVQKQGIINTAETNFLIEKRSWEVEGALGAKIDFYAYQNLRDQLAETQRQLLVAQDRNYNDNKFAEINAQLASISYNQLKAPQFMPYGGYVAATCGNYGGCSGCSCGC